MCNSTFYFEYFDIYKPNTNLTQDYVLNSVLKST